MGLFSGRSRRRSSRQRRLPLTRFIGPTVTLVGLFLAAGTWLMGGVNFSTLDPAEDGEVVQASYQNPISDGLGDAAEIQVAVGRGVLPRTGDAGKSGERRIRIATFNIKQFGPKKASNPEVMDWIARLVSRFDVIALQEIHGSDAEPIRKLIAQLRSGGADYAATVSEKIGSSDRYTEAYAFLWNERTIQMVSGSDYLVADPGQRMAREPMACSFRCIVPVESNVAPFSFTLINAHTSPSQVAASATLNEMDVLDDVYLSIAQYSGRTLAEDDIILLGDLNVDANELRELGDIPNLRSVAGLEPTNMLGSKIYDHILINSRSTAEFTGRAGVVDVARDLKLTEQQSLKISDHRPVWAEFAASEAGVQTASLTRIIR